ncbi:MAG: ECF transporter S component [Oscillospiraceae bacterium]
MIKTKRLIVSAICLAGCMLLPFVSGQIPEIGRMLSPMHLPVLICGFVCGWQYGLALGAIAPILRFFIFGMPVLFPVGLAMTFELATYGLFTGLLYQLFPKSKLVYEKNSLNHLSPKEKPSYAFIYLNLLLSMIAGRLVWGLAMTIISGVSTVPFSVHIFITSAVITAIPAIILQFIIVPPCVIILKKVGCFYNEK